MCTPELSIIVYARGSAPVIGRTLESIRGQVFQEWECLVVEDGSSDNTSAIVQSVVETDGRFVLVRQSYGGVAKARNRGFLESTPAAAYVAFMDAGDVWASNALTDLAKCLEGDLSAVGAHGLAGPMDRDGRPLVPGGEWRRRARRLGYRDGAIMEWSPGEPTSFETLAWTDVLSPAGVLLVRRTAYEEVGLYDPSLVHCWHWDITLRLSRLGPIRFLDKVVLYQADCDAPGPGDGGMTVNAVRQLQRKMFFSAENSPRQNAVLREGWRVWLRFKIKENLSAAFGGLMQGAPARAFRHGGELFWHLVDYVAGRPALLRF